MVDLAQQQPIDVSSVGFDASADRRSRLWYYAFLVAFLIGPAIAALAIMGWVKAP